MDGEARRRRVSDCSSTAVVGGLGLGMGALQPNCMIDCLRCKCRQRGVSSTSDPEWAWSRLSVRNEGTKSAEPRCVVMGCVPQKVAGGSYHYPGIAFVWSDE